MARLRVMESGPIWTLVTVMTCGRVKGKRRDLLDIVSNVIVEDQNHSFMTNYPVPGTSHTLWYLFFNDPSICLSETESPAF